MSRKEEKSPYHYCGNCGKKYDKNDELQCHKCGWPKNRGW